MKTKILITLIIGVMFASCSVSHILTNDNAQRYQPTETENVEVFSTSKINREYVIIGDVVSRVEDFNGADASVKYLKKEAAKLGASAIIKVNLSKPVSFPGSTSISGVAVKLKES